MTAFSIMRLIRIGLYCFCLLNLSGLYAQTPFFKQVGFSVENAKVGVNAMYIDRNRFIWLATDDGILKFDGRKSTNYLLNGQTQIPEATAVFEDSHQNVWAGYDNGAIARVQDRVFKLFKPLGPLPKKRISSITEDSKGRLWITTSGDGVFYIINNNIYKISTDNGLSDDYTYSIAEDSTGRIWIGTDQGISICTMTSNGVHINKLNELNGLPEEIVRKLVADENGNIWAGLQEKGICKINSYTLQVSIPKWIRNWENGQINDILISKTEIWIATEDHGLFNSLLLDTEVLKNYKSYGTLDFSQISILKTDEENNLWLANKTGLLQSQGSTLMFLNEIGDEKIKFVHAICASSENKIYFTPDQGLSVVSTIGEKVKVKNYKIATPGGLYDISSLYEDEFGCIWIGTMGDGLYRFNPFSNIKQKINQKELNHASILSITSQNESLWLATLGGVIRCALPQNCNDEKINVNAELLDTVPELGNYYIYAVFTDSRKRVWFGTDKKGLTVFDNGRFKNINSKNGISGNTIYSIMEDPQGNIWFSIAGHGICRYDGRSFKNYSEAEGLRELTVTSIRSIDADRILMVHRWGFDVLHVSTGKIDFYSAENKIEEINPDLNAIAFDNENKIWIGTEKGLVIFDPAKNVNPAGPKVVLQRVTLFNLNKNFISEREFKHNQNYLAFEFTGIWFMDPARVKYQYMLSGYSKDWVNTTDDHVIFPNLRTGNYTFKVRASLSKSFAVFDEAEYNFTINKPFWATTWFRVTLALVVILAGGLFIKNHDTRVRRIEALKNESIQYRFETLKSQVNPHFLFNSFNTLISIIDKDKNIAIEYVEKLSDYFRNMIQHRDKVTISLRDEIEMVNTYYYLQKKRFGQFLQLDIKIPEEVLAKFKVPPLSLQLLIENAVKHNMVTKATPLKIEIFFSNDDTVTVKNNINVKLNKEVSTGIGLENITSRYKILSNRKVLIYSDQRVFSVTVPLIT